MATRERGGIQAAIPWVALAVVSVFAFGQLGQRNRAQTRAAKAEDDLRAAQALAQASSAGTTGGSTSPQAFDAPTSPGSKDPGGDGRRPGITDRERKLDAALQGALQVAREDTKRLGVLREERDAERRRGERLAAQLDTARARADALDERLRSTDEGAAARVKELEAALATVEADAAAALSDLEAQLEEAFAACEKCEAARQKAAREVAEYKKRSAEQASRLSGVIVQLNDAATRAKAAEAELTTMRQRVSKQSSSTAAALEKAQGGLTRMAAQLDQVVAEAARETRAREAAEDVLVALRRRMREAAILQLASENPRDVVTGARMVGLLHLSGLGERLLVLTEHEEAAVAAAAARALAATPDLPGNALAASDAAVALLADESIGVRLAALALLRAATSEEIAFDPGASAAERGAAIQKLKKRLGG